MPTREKRKKKILLKRIAPTDKIKPGTILTPHREYELNNKFYCAVLIKLPEEIMRNKIEKNYWYFHNSVRHDIRKVSKGTTFVVLEVFRSPIKNLFGLTPTLIKLLSGGEIFYLHFNLHRSNSSINRPVSRYFAIPVEGYA